MGALLEVFALVFIVMTLASTFVEDMEIQDEDDPIDYGDRDDDPFFPYTE